MYVCTYACMCVCCIVCHCRSFYVIVGLVGHCSIRTKLPCHPGFRPLVPKGPSNSRRVCRSPGQSRVSPRQEIRGVIGDIKCRAAWEWNRGLRGDFLSNVRCWHGCYAIHAEQHPCQHQKKLEQILLRLWSKHNRDQQKAATAPSNSWLWFLKGIDQPREQPLCHGTFRSCMPLCRYAFKNREMH